MHEQFTLDWSRHHPACVGRFHLRSHHCHLVATAAIVAVALHLVAVAAAVAALVPHLVAIQMATIVAGLVAAVIETELEQVTVGLQR